MSTSPRLGFTYLVVGQAVPETAVNALASYLEAAAGHFIFKSRSIATPPGSPAAGDCYLIAASPTGAWAGQAGNIAFYLNTGWVIIAATDGYTAIVLDEAGAFIGRVSGSWSVLAAPSGVYMPLSYLDTDGTMAANSDSRVASQKAVRTYVANAVTGLLNLQTGIDCSANPNYPAASKGYAYEVTVGGKIGGASGISVSVGDVVFALANNAGGTQAAVGSSWDVLVHSASTGGGLLASNNLSDVLSPVAAKDNISKQSSSIASAATTDLSTATGDYVTVTGTTTITSFGTCAAGVERIVRFSAALTLTYNATSLILPTSANITTAAGDVATLRSEGSGNWRCIDYQRANGQPLASAGVSVAIQDVGVAQGTSPTLNFTGSGVSATVSGGVAVINIPGSGGAIDVPGLINDLVFWVETDNILASSGSSIEALINRTPWNNWPFGATANTGATIDSAQLNGKPVLNFAGTSDGRYNSVTQIGTKLSKCTVFALFQPNSVGLAQAFMSGATGALNFRIETTGKLGLVKDNTVNIGQSTGTVSAGTWYQANATYDASTGAYAFRLSKAASGSGTNAQTITSQTYSIGYDEQIASADLNSKLAALIVYNRVLSGTEIANVENYLTSKWGI